MTEDLVKLREIAEKVAPGAWTAWRPFDEPEYWILSERPQRTVASGVAPDDAAFLITFDPPTVLALLADNARMREVLEEIRSTIGRITTPSWPDLDNIDHTARQALSGASDHAD